VTPPTDERRRAVALAGLLLAISAATKLGDGIVQTLFLERVGARWLPGLFALNAFCDVIAGAAYLRLARGRPHGSFFVRLLGGTALSTLLLRALVFAAHPAVFVTAAVVHGVATMIGTLHWGTFLLDFFDQDRASRLFPIVYSGARLGGIAGGVLLAVLARLGADDLLVLVAVLQAVAAFAARALARTVPPVHAADAGLGFWGEVRGGLGLARRSSLLRALAFGAIAMVLVRQVLRYLSGDALAAEMDEATLSRFLGQYTALANGLGFAFQVLLMPWLMGRFGVEGTNLGYAVLCFVALAAMALAPGIWTAAAARLADQELKDAVKTPLSNLFYGALPAEERARGRAFVLGLAVPAGAIAGGLGLQSLTGLSRTIVAVIGLALGALFGAATIVQNRGYRRARAQTLEE